ncbi:Uncharacterized protein PBTT_07976 [Plasmodiophora brassicae]
MAVDVVCLWADRTVFGAGLAFEAHKMNLMAITSDGSALFVASGAGLYWTRMHPGGRIDWRAETPHRQRVLTASSEINCVASGRCDSVDLVLAGTESGDVYVVRVDPSGAHEHASFSNVAADQDDLSVWSVVCCKTRPEIITSSNTHLISAYSLSGEPAPVLVRRMAGHSHNIPCIAVSDDDCFLASASIDRAVCIWDAKSGSLLHRRSMDHLQFGWAVCFFPWHAVGLGATHASATAGQAEDSDAADISSESDGEGEVRLTDDPFYAYARIVADDTSRATDDGILRLPLLQETAVGEVGAQTGRYVRLCPNRSGGDTTDETQRDRPLVVFCNQSMIFLLTFDLSLLGCARSDSPCCSLLDPRCRLSFLNVVPELSLVIVGCARSNQLSLLRVVRSKGGACFERLGLAPQSPQSRMPLIGVSVCPGHVDPDAPEPLRFWRLFLLHYDGTLCSLELRRPIASRELDLSGVII